MEPWVIALVVIFVIGVVVIGYGSIADRKRRERALAAIKSPPKRDIPRFAPDAEPPRYLTDLEAHRPPEDATSTELSAEDRTEISTQLKDSSPTIITARRASDFFITDKTSGWSVLDRPRVLVCADPIRSVRELLSVLERMIAARQSLVIMAPEFAEDVRKTLEVNRIRNMLNVLALIADDDARAAAITATEAVAASAGDLQAGYLPDDHLGRCDRWVAESRRSSVIAAADH
ncbi:hypothetical protein [Microlunatus speluncae]|uniref:hypothetical protein n=1 Tax=Microlunatus speluncae TaxID=2594267 RepID=UPI001266183F|nr:hypothetical protein [Microlunatus speluncae]